jgi:hypothetical protein
MRLPVGQWPRGRRGVGLDRGITTAAVEGPEREIRSRTSWALRIVIRAVETSPSPAVTLSLRSSTPRTTW